MKTLEQVDSDNQLTSDCVAVIEEYSGTGDIYSCPSCGQDIPKDAIRLVTHCTRCQYLRRDVATFH